MTMTTKKAASRGRAKRPDTTRMRTGSSRRRRATPPTTLDALQSIVGKLRNMSADAAARASLAELLDWTHDQANHRPATPTDADVAERRMRMFHVARAQRRINSDPDHFYFFLVAWACIEKAEDQWPRDPATAAIWAKIDAIKQREGLTEGECWMIGEGPADYQELERQSTDRYDQVVIDTMRQMGEPDLAALYRDDRDTFDQRYEQGRFAGFGPIPDMGSPGLAK